MHIMALFLLTACLMIISTTLAWPFSLPDELRNLDIATLIRTDADATALASSDFGNVSTASPAAVLQPSSPGDIAALVRASYTSVRPFPISARGRGHSLRGQAFAPGGVVVDMPSLGRRAARRINVSVDDRYVDAGGEQLWVDVLHAALEQGLAPRSWTDYLHLTVGGTLSNAGISGQAFRHGPQISNVYELDVITGLGEMVTCSKEKDSDLFHAVLGGLGQFGIITRARIALAPSPAMVRRVRLMYTDVSALTGDQERLITEGDALFGLMDYVEGSVLADPSLIGSWRSSPPSSFFSERDMVRVSALAEETGGALYCLEGALYYDDSSATLVDEELDLLLRELNFAPGFAFTQDVSYVDFLDRVHDGERKLRAAGLWDVPHPWLNLFLPKSRVLDFDSGIFKGFVKHNRVMGPVLIYPMNKNKWDEKMSAVIPDAEDIFYTVGILRSAVTDGDLEYLEDQNVKIMQFCEQTGIDFKQYLPHYTSQADWMKHFGSKWRKFVTMKAKFDPKAILSRGQNIFTSSLDQDYHVSHQQLQIF